MKRILLLLIIASCSCRKNTYNPVFPNQPFQGRGIVYFRYPISGLTHQMIFIPTNKVINDLSELSAKDFDSGCCLWLSSRRHLSNIYSSKKIAWPENFQNEINPKQRIINFANVFVRLKVGRRDNDFPRSIRDTLELNKRKLVFEYFIPEEAKIDSLGIIE